MRVITPQPGFTEADVEAVMDSGSFVYADFFTILPKEGDPMRYTDFQYSLTLVPIGESTPQEFRSDGLLLKGLRVKASVGIEVDEQSIECYYSADLDFQGQLSWPKALLLGRLDGGVIRRDRMIANPSLQWIGGFTMFKGLISTLNTVGSTQATMNVKSDLVLLNVQMPRDLWEPNCKNTLGDTACGVNLEDYAVSASVATGSTRSYIAWGSSSGDYALGKIVYDPGDGINRVRTISRADTGGLYLSYPLDFDPSLSDSFTVYPGCNRTMDRCPFFHPTDWQQFFKGFPYIPVAETAVG